MANFRGVAAEPDGADIRVRFKLDTPGVVGWQIYDPSTDAFLFEGEWIESGSADVEIQVALPPGDGDYRIQVAPVADRRRFVLIDAHVGGGHLEMQEPRITSARALRRERFWRAIPKAFVYPARSLWRNRKLMASLVKRDVTARYRGSFGGVLWTFLNPLLLMATYFFVFGVFLGQRFGNDPSRGGFVLYLLAGMLPWLAFAEAVGRSPSIMLEYRSFVKKLVFPIETLPVNLVISGAVTEAFGLLIFIGGILIARHSMPLSILWLPALIIPQLLFTAGLCWFLAALGVFLRDLGQIIGFLLTLWFFLTPICYEESQQSRIGPAAAKILALNPILTLVRGYRAIFLEHHAPDLTTLAMLWILAMVVALLGHAWFHRLRRSFADVI